MTYSPTVWVRGGPPGLDADPLNKLEQGLKNASYFFNVAEQGAVGNGNPTNHTADTAGFQNTLALIPTTGSLIGGLVWVPPGAYYLDKPLFIPDRCRTFGSSSGGNPILRCSANFPTALLNGGLTLPAATIPVQGTINSNFPTAGVITIPTDAGMQDVYYTGISGNSFTGCTGGSGTAADGAVIGTYLVFLGTPGGSQSGVFGAGLREVFLDLSTDLTSANWVPGASGVFTNRAQELAGLDSVGISHVARTGVKLAPAPGATTAQNWQLRGIRIQMNGSNSEATAVGLWINGNTNPARNIEDVTVSSYLAQQTPAGSIGILLQGVTAVRVGNAQLEYLTEAVRIDNATAKNQAVEVNNIFANSCTTAVHITTGGSSDAPYSLRAIHRSGSTTNLIVDDELGLTLTDQNVGRWLVSAKVSGRRWLDTDVQTSGFKSRSGGVSTQTPGAVTTVTIAHGLYRSPADYRAQPANAAARGAPAFHVTADATNITLNFASALTAATSYAWTWAATA